MNRGFRNSQTNNGPVGQTAHNPASGTSTEHRGKGKGKLSSGKLGQWGKFGFLILLVVLIALAFLSLVMFKGDKNESRLVDTSKYQAVFLNGGQVYFGKVADLNDKFLNVNNVYYLRVNQQVQPDANAQQNNSNDISLVKLGCELHGPTDQMVINREQVIFWENLKEDGQVAKAIKQYQETYPNGQSCEEQAASQNSATPQVTPKTEENKN